MSTSHRRAAPVCGIVLLLVLAVITGCAERSVVTRDQEAPEPGQPPEADAADAERRVERAILDLVNEERRRRDLPPLEWDDQLARRASEWSRNMADQGRLFHQEPEQMLERVEGFTAVGANIFRASGPVPASTIHLGWMRSGGHRANVLREGFDRLAVGVLCTEDGQVWATQRFGRTAGSDLPRPTGDIPPEEPIVAAAGEGPSCPGEIGEVEIELQHR